jgi:hypothetical protein
MPARVLALIHNPRCPSESNRKLSEVLRWNDPDDLAHRYIADVRECSHGRAEFEIVDRIEVDGFPVKADGFVYTPETFLRCWRSRSGFHQPDGMDYHRLLDEFDIVARVNGGEVDEVWLFGFPYAGYYESIMVGPGAVWCNAPPLERRDAQRRFIVMGFNYERGAGEMLEDLGHRAESIVSHIFRHTRGDANLWERFTRYDKTHPGRAECGNVHFAPNSLQDYDWGNARYVVSGCEAWLQFPNLSATRRRVNCAEWGGGDIRLHHLWWFQRFPHVEGASDGVSHNWWEYVVNPNRL